MTRFVGLGRAEVTTPDEMTSVEDHLAAIIAMLPRPEPIELRLGDALGLVVAEDVRCEVVVPAFDSSAMDGYAVVAADLDAASPTAPVELTVVGDVVAGGGELPSVGRGTCVRIMTGAQVPRGADTVVPVEVTVGGGETATFLGPVPPGANVRRAGEDLTPGVPLLRVGKRMGPAEVAILSTAGITRVTCIPAPRVVVLSTGDELVRADEVPAPGQVRDSNGPMLAAMVRAAGGLPFTTGIVGDSVAALTEAFEMNRGHADLFVVSGGASAGTRDLLPDVLASIGEGVAVKVAMRPGMPQVRGLVHGTPVVGLPGNPVSAFVSFEVFVRPALRYLQGRRDTQRPTVVARAVEPMSAPPHKRGYVRVRLARGPAGWEARPTGGQGSNLVSSIAAADGLAIVPEAVTDVRVGDEVRVLLLVE